MTILSCAIHSLVPRSTPPPSPPGPGKEVILCKTTDTCTMVFQVVCCLPTLCLQEDKHRQQEPCILRMTEKIDHVKYPFSTILPSCISYIVRPQFVDFSFSSRVSPAHNVGRQVLPLFSQQIFLTKEVDKLKLDGKMIVAHYPPL